MKLLEVDHQYLSSESETLSLSDLSLTSSTQGTSEYEFENQLVVGLDFGTTFSGIAYAFKNQEKPDVISVMHWPGIPLLHSDYLVA